MPRSAALGARRGRPANHSINANGPVAIGLIHVVRGRQTSPNSFFSVRENKDDFPLGLHLSKQPPVIGAILLDLARRETDNRSLALARAIVTATSREIRLLPKPHRSADFAVLSAPDIPSALVEIGCLSNPDEEKLLPTPSHQRRLTQTLMRAIDDYFAGLIRT